MDPPTLAQLERAWIEVDNRTPAQPQKLRAWAFRQILSGHRPTLAQAARELSMTTADVTDALQNLQDAGLITSREDTITGSMGLTHEQTPHEVKLDGRIFHVWCALDAVGIPAALRRPARITSRSGDGADLVELDYDGTRWTPPDAFEVLVTLPEADDCINEDVCPSINFYAPRTAPKHPRAAALSLDDAAKLGFALWSRYA